MSLPSGATVSHRASFKQGTTSGSGKLACCGLDEKVISLPEAYATASVSIADLSMSDPNASIPRRSVSGRNLVRLSMVSSALSARTKSP